MNTEDNTYALKHEKFCQQINFKPKEVQPSQLIYFKPDGLAIQNLPKKSKKCFINKL